MAPTPLNHVLVTAGEAKPAQWIYFLHGILGSGSNWRSFARQLVLERPQWGAVLVDLRMHGLSQHFVSPHTLATATADLLALEAALPGPVRGVVGHSFGGKVALLYAAERAQTLTHAFFLDSMPGARADFHGSESTLEVVDLLETFPPTFPDRKAFMKAVTEGGKSEPLAAWLAMNLERLPAPEGDGYRLRLELPAIHAMLEDYFRADLWPLLESLPLTLRTDIVIGARSTVFLPPERARVVALAGTHPNLHVHVLANAGHWIHVDDPSGVAAVLRAGLQ